MSLKAVVKFFNGTNETDKQLSNFVDRATKRSALVMERNIKDVSRRVMQKRTGNLGRSIRARDIEFAKSEVVINPISEGADVNYAIHLEYGTRFITPRAFIRKGVEQSREKIQQIFAEEAKNVVISITGVK